jgi:hypothetical protein
VGGDIQVVFVLGVVSDGSSRGMLPLPVILGCAVKRLYMLIIEQTTTHLRWHENRCLDQRHRCERLGK